MSSHASSLLLDSEEELFPELELPPHEIKSNVKSMLAKLNLRYFITKRLGGFKLIE